jgi:hypothetical protein
MEKGDTVFIEEWLLRRSYCNPEKNYCNPDGSATSRVFKLRAIDQGQLSVDIKSLTTVETAIKDPTRFILFELANATVEENGLRTIYDPLEDGTNPAHALITGMAMEDEVTPGILGRKSRRVFF